MHCGNLLKHSQHKIGCELTMTLTRPDKRRRVVIEGITPEVDGGRFPAKRTVGDKVRVEADIFSDGHDAISASLIAHREGSDVWTQIPMHPQIGRASCRERV